MQLVYYTEKHGTRVRKSNEAGPQTWAEKKGWNIHHRDEDGTGCVQLKLENMERQKKQANEQRPQTPYLHPVSPDV